MKALIFRETGEPKSVLKLAISDACLHFERLAQADQLHPNSAGLFGL